MVSIITRKNKKGIITSYGFSVSNYPKPAIRMGGFKTKKEATTIAKEIEKKLALEKMQCKLLKAGYVHQTFLKEFEKWMNKKKINLNPKTIQSYVNTKNKIEKYFGDTLLKDITLIILEKNDSLEKI